MRRAICRLLGVEPLVGALGQPRDGAAHAAGLLVGAQAQRAAVAPLPELEQRRRQQRQRAGLALDVGDQRIDRSGSTRRPARRGGQLDRPAQLVAAHRPDEHVVGAEQPRQLRVGGAAAVEVGADGDQHQRAPPRVARARDERVDERRALGLVAAGGEDLLELVDREDEPAARRRSAVACSSARSGCSPGRSSASAQRSLPGSTPAASAASSPARSAEDLPLPDGPTIRQQRRTGQPRHHLGDEPLAPEEDPGIVHVERRETLEGAGDDAVGLGGPQVGALARRLQLDDVARQLVLRRAQHGALGRDAAGGVRQAADRASVRAHSPAARCRRWGTPPLASASRSTGTSASSRSPA